MATISTDSELILNIKNLSDTQKDFLSRRLRPEEIEQTFEAIKSVIAIEAKRRIQAKIALSFIGGYGKGELFESIYTYFEGDTLHVASTKSYMEILNKGYDGFDMKKALMGNRVKMRLPGGAVIYRTVGINDSTSKPRRGRPLSTARWIHPGYQGKHLYKMVEEEMKPWIQAYVRNQIQLLIRRAGSAVDVYKKYDEPTPTFGVTTNGNLYFNNRDNQGRFSSTAKRKLPIGISETKMTPTKKKM